MHGIVFGTAPDDFHRAGRTERSLNAAGIVTPAHPALSREALAQALRSTTGPLLLARAGSWLASPASIWPIPSSATGRPLIGCGAIWHSPAWTRYLSQCGGDLQRRSWWPRALPDPGFLYLESAVVGPFAALLESGHSPQHALPSLVRDRRFRAVHLPALDAHFDSAMRVLQLVTTIQIGGAERVTLDLAEELTRQGVAVCVAIFGQSTRLSYPPPPHFADLSELPNQPEDRAQAVVELARKIGADLVHAHLIRAAEARAIRRRGMPLAMTLHNMPQAWPIGLDQDPLVADFVFTCSRAVESAWREHLTTTHSSSSRVIDLPVRTLWNGIDPKPLAPAESSRLAAAGWRAACGWSAETFVLTTIANPRPQKRLHLLPEILRHVATLLSPRPVRLVVAGARGDAATVGAEAWRAIAETDDAAARCGTSESIHWTGGTHDITTILAASDVLVSPSAFEGLSLAHLEALAAGVPVVATDVGGTSEIDSALLRLVPRDATPDTFAKAIAALAIHPGTRTPALPPSFTRYRMAERARQLYPRVIERHRITAPGDGLWLITNNFSTGGAQTSARRLLQGLADAGVNVRAFTVQEESSHPTPGRTALQRAGIPVLALPQIDAAEAVGQLLAHAASAPPAAILFWNLIASYKILLADALTGIPIYDVSPGEMYYSALEKYFSQPRAGLPYRTPRDYGARLTGVVVKYHAEVSRAATFGAAVHVIPNGVPFRDSPPRRRHHRLVIGTAARLSPDKRLEDLIESFRLALPQLPKNSALHIAGGVEPGAESYARHLRTLARGLPVQWRGALPDSTGFLQSLDIFAMISEPAGCPNASLEALAAGLPVVATDFGGASEQVLDGITGRLTARGDHQAFAQALVELARDPVLRDRLAAAGRAHVRSHFSLTRMVDHYRNLCFPSEAPRPEEETPSLKAAFCTCQWPPTPHERHENTAIPTRH